METSPDNKEEKFIIHEEKVQFFSTRKLIRLFLALFLAFFGAFGLLFFIDITLYPDLGMMELARKAQEKTDAWRSAKRSDLGHEAIAFEEMLDAYALQGGDISHALDTLTDEFTAANWAELLEYDVDYFLKHEEVDDSTKYRGMLHVTKILYTSGHYDLFKQGYKIMVNRFVSNGDYLTIYTNLIPLEANFEYDDEEERAELDALYELELRRHLKLTAAQIINNASGGSLTSNQLQEFVESLHQTMELHNVMAGKSSKFTNQIESDMVQILSIIKDQAKGEDNSELLQAGYALASYLGNQNMPGLTDLAQEYSAIM